jgi:hypothetical protein
VGEGGKDQSKKTVDMLFVETNEDLGSAFQLFLDGDINLHLPRQTIVEFINFSRPVGQLDPVINPALNGNGLHRDLLNLVSEVEVLTGDSINLPSAYGSSQI